MGEEDMKRSEIDEAQKAVLAGVERTWKLDALVCTVKLLGSTPVFSVSSTNSTMGLGVSELSGDQLAFVLSCRRAFERWASGQADVLPPSVQWVQAA
jgi:hypothetical protein